MPEHSWNIISHQGDQYRLSLFHGDKTQHVVVHCNNQIVAIDFSVREAKTYSVFVDQELCEVSIDPSGPGQYSYNCRINHEVATPLNEYRNRLRREEEYASKLNMMVGGACVVVFVLLMVFGG